MYSVYFMTIADDDHSTRAYRIARINFHIIPSLNNISKIHYFDRSSAGIDGSNYFDLQYHCMSVPIISLM